MLRAPARLATALATVLATVIILSAGCSSDTPDADGPTSAGPTVAESPSASPSGTPSPTPSPTPSATYSATGVTVPVTVTGLHVAGVQEGAWPDSNVPFGSLRLWDAGTNWSQVESIRGRYDWNALDRALDTAEQNRMADVLLVLGGTPTWNASRIRTGDYPVPGAASAPKSLPAWDAFVTAVVKRYTGRISAYQIWNEASLTMFWNGSPERMAELTKRAADIIHANDPQAKVVAASTTVRLPGAFDRFFPRYLAALAELGWPVDVFAAHMYPASMETTDERSGFITGVQAELAEAGAPALPLWDTELNYGLAGPGPTNPKQSIGGAQARDWVVETTFDSLRQGIARTYWYIWTPEPYSLLGLQLTNDSGAVKGLRIVRQWAIGATSYGCIDDGSVVSCSLVKNEVPSIIAWAVTDSAVFTPPSDLTQACSTTNECTAVTGPVTLTETPMRFVP